MIPSDHFVKFYNEVFKFLQKQGSEHLERYYQEISRHQQLHCLELFRKEGLKGMYDYWEHIRVEENCDSSHTLETGHLTMRMNVCPSLSKVLDNDAAPCSRYCDHCPGWVLPLMTQVGKYIVYNLVDRSRPCCASDIYDDPAEARKKYAELIQQFSPDLIHCNFPVDGDAENPSRPSSGNPI